MSPPELSAAWAGPLIVALELTLWIERRAIARASGVAKPEPPVAELARDLLVWLVPIGVLSLVFHGGASGFGWVLIAIGAVGTPSPGPA